MTIKQDRWNIVDPMDKMIRTIQNVAYFQTSFKRVRRNENERICGSLCDLSGLFSTAEIAKSAERERGIFISSNNSYESKLPVDLHRGFRTKDYSLFLSFRD